MNTSQAIAAIESARNILITSHVRPDGDAIGSAAALKQAIRAKASGREQNPTVEILFLGEVPQVYQFIATEPVLLWGRDVTEEQVQAGRLEEYDLIIVVDTSAIRQLPGIGEYLQKRQKKVLVIDHHLSGEGIGHIRLINTGACAAGELVYGLIRQAGWPLDKTAAAAIMTAIGTDTGWFRFENASAKAFRIAAELIESGIAADDIYQQIYLSDPPERLRLLGMVLETLEILCGGRLALIHITRDMLNRSGAKRSHIENIVNAPQQIGSVIAVALLVEEEDGGTRCSLRSKTLVDVNAVARQFGGGGHARAAGLTIPEGLPEAKAKILAALSRELE